MKTKAILATDLSEASDILINCSNFYKNLGIKKITLFHALGVEYMNFYGYVNLDSTKERLENQKKSLESMGFEVDIIIKEGISYLELKEYAKIDNETLLIIGTKGKGYLRELTLGSTANYLIKNVNNPILVIKCNEDLSDKHIRPKLQCNSTFENVVFPTDFSQNSDKAFTYLKNLLNKNFKKISIIHVQEAPSKLNKFQNEDESLSATNKSLLENLKKQLTKIDELNIDTFLLKGNPTKELLSFIEKNNTSLVIMGKHGQGFFSQMILGSITRRVIEESRSNCLIVPNN